MSATNTRAPIGCELYCDGLISEAATPPSIRYAQLACPISSPSRPTATAETGIVQPNPTRRRPALRVAVGYSKR